MLHFGIVSEYKPGFVRVKLEADGIVTSWLPVIVSKSLSDKSSYPLEVNEHVACMMDEQCEFGVVLGAIYSEADAPDAAETKDKFRMKFADGTLIEYNKSTHKLIADVKGPADIKATGNVLIETSLALTAKAGTLAKIEALNIEASATVKATVDAAVIEAKAIATALIKAPLITLEGTVAVLGVLSAGTISTTGAFGSGKMISTGDIETTGEVKATDVKAGLISLLTHKHLGVTTGGGTSGTPTP